MFTWYGRVLRKKAEEEKPLEVLVEIRHIAFPDIFYWPKQIKWPTQIQEVGK